MGMKNTQKQPKHSHSGVEGETRGRGKLGLGSWILPAIIVIYPMIGFKFLNLDPPTLAITYVVIGIAIIMDAFLGGGD